LLMRFFFLSSALLLLSGWLSAQGYTGARSAALAGSAVTLSDEWSALNNQAGMAFCGAARAAVFYESRFLVPGLGDKGFAGSVPVGRGAAGISFRSFGTSLFSSSRVGLAYALKLDEKLSLGVQTNYHAVRIAEGYGTTRTFTIEGGAVYRMNERLTIAAHLFNPTRSRLAEFNDERMASMLRGGASYSFSRKVKLLAEIRKSSDRNPALSTGLEYDVAEYLSIRLGAGTNPGLTSFGIGWQVGSWRMDASSSYHSILGFSPQVSLAYAPPAKP